MYEGAFTHESKDIDCGYDSHVCRWFTHEATWNRERKLEKNDCVLLQRKKLTFKCRDLTVFKC